VEKIIKGCNVNNYDKIINVAKSLTSKIQTKHSPNHFLLKQCMKKN